MLPEEQARIKIDKQLKSAGWDIVSRDEFILMNASAVKEALMQGNKESDYLLFVDGKAIAVVEAKKESNDLGDDVATQAEYYSRYPQTWYGVWFQNQIPLVYLANGNKILFKNMLTEPNGDYVELGKMHSPKKMLSLIGQKSEYGALPWLDKTGLRDCQYNAEINLERKLKEGHKKSLAVLATGSGKTYLACLASYRLLSYTSARRVLFLVDRNNLARQTEEEYGKFTRTENGEKFNSIYQVNRLKNADEIGGDVIISTIQKLFAIMTGQAITEEDEDAEDERLFKENDRKKQDVITIGNDLRLPPDYFQFIIVDECHRSIYGKWQAVLNYFTSAKILGLTATPTPEAYAFFNSNTIEEYTYEDSVVDGVNVPARIYSIGTRVTKHGDTIAAGEVVQEVSRRAKTQAEVSIPDQLDYTPTELDRSVVNPLQIETVLTEYRNIIYTQLYPDRTENWAYIPKTLIFAKDDNHATKIVEAIKTIFAEKFTDSVVPEKFVQKITYSAGDSNALIRDFRVEKEFRIAVTVTLVATGTDIRPLEVVLFMNDVKSEVLYTQMKGRGCRVINDDQLKEVTPNAETKECYYIVDAVGVTESEKHMPPPVGPGGERVYSLENLLEHLSHNEVSDDNLALLRDYCASIHKRYENNIKFGKHLTNFITNFYFSPRELANDINAALASNALPPFTSPSDSNTARSALISRLMNNLDARKAILELQKGYYFIAPGNDEVIYTGFSKETARSFIDTFENYLNDNKDKIEALRIIYNSEDVAITHSMLSELAEKLTSANREYTPYYIWQNYKLLDEDGNVDELDAKHNVRALTHLIQIVRYAYHKNERLTSLFGGYLQRFNLYCGQTQRKISFTEDQKTILKQIADYIVGEGSVTPLELIDFAPDLWRRAVKSFGGANLANEMNSLSKFILKVA